MVKSSRRSRTRHSRKRVRSTRRHRKTHARRRSTKRTSRGGARCFDSQGNPDPDGLYNVDGSRNSNCPN